MLRARLLLPISTLANPCRSHLIRGKRDQRVTCKAMEDMYGT